MRADPVLEVELGSRTNQAQAERTKMTGGGGGGLFWV
jgi:hypothetical protein